MRHDFLLGCFVIQARLIVFHQIVVRETENRQLLDFFISETRDSC